MILTARTAAFLAVTLAAALGAVLVALALAPRSSHAAGHELCFSDDSGDVRNLEGQPAEVAQADIVEVCGAYDEQSLRFSLRVAEPTDPDADGGWQEGSSAAIWHIQAQAQAYGGPSGQLFLGVQDGDLRAVATWYDDQTPVCEGDGEFDGTWYGASFDPDCLDVPDTISFSAYFQHDANPADEEDWAAVYADVAPEGMGREGDGRYAGPLTRAGVTPPSERLAGRLAGPTRIDTAVEVSRSQFPRGAEEVYLAREDDFPDALAGGSLTRGPILLVPSCGPLPQAVGWEIERLDPDRVLALGGTEAVCDDLLHEARDR